MDGKFQFTKVSKVQITRFNIYKPRRRIAFQVCKIVEGQIIERDVPLKPSRRVEGDTINWDLISIPWVQ